MYKIHIRTTIRKREKERERKPSKAKISTLHIELNTFCVYIFVAVVAFGLYICDFLHYIQWIAMYYSSAKKYIENITGENVYECFYVQPMFAMYFMCEEY